MTGRKIMLFIFCFMIGFSLIVLARMSNGQRLYVSPKVLDEYQITIEGEKQDMTKLNEKIEEMEIRYAEYEARADDESALLSHMKEELVNDIALYRLKSGAAPAVGSGVEIFIDDGEQELLPWDNPNDILVHDTDILLIINDLKVAGAEAISVNGQRLVDESAIVCSGYTVRINDQFFATPYVIKAIGNGSRMASALIGPGGHGTVLKDYVIFKVKVTDDIFIPGYVENRNYKYMSAVATAKNKDGESN